MIQINYLKSFGSLIETLVNTLKILVNKLYQQRKSGTFFSYNQQVTHGQKVKDNENVR